MAKENRRGSNPIVLSRFQRWFIASSLAYLVSVLGLLDFGIYLWYRVTAGEFFRVAGLLSPTLLQNMQHSVRSGLWILLAVNAVIVALSVLHSMHFSRKIAGPIYALFRHLDRVKIARGWIPFKLRNEDLFAELPEKLEAAFTSVDSDKSSKAS